MSFSDRGNSSKAAGSGLKPGTERAERRVMAMPPRTVERLSVYRRLLAQCQQGGKERVYSHDLAAHQPFTPAQVRRDLMNIGYTGSPARGYEVAGLLGHIDALMDPGEGENVALVGVGHLGRAVLDYFSGRQRNLSIVAAFDVNADKVGRVIHGCHCYHLDELGRVAETTPILVGVVCVPGGVAQEVSDRLVAVGVRGILTFSPLRLRVPERVYVEQVDIAVSLEKVAFFARAEAGSRESLT